mmetsp:Transcript_13840/g.31948  ORF Transcript_13840/g.31948 Transcript_13840/m.31948 type:complete len:232 (-) Transcript_13840:915-1610(-)
MDRSKRTPDHVFRGIVDRFVEHSGLRLRRIGDPVVATRVSSNAAGIGRPHGLRSRDSSIPRQQRSFPESVLGQVSGIAGCEVLSGHRGRSVCQCRKQVHNFLPHRRDRWNFRCRAGVPETRSVLAVAGFLFSDPALSRSLLLSHRSEPRIGWGCPDRRWVHGGVGVGLSQSRQGSTGFSTVSRRNAGPGRGRTRGRTKLSAPRPDHGALSERRTKYGVSRRCGGSNLWLYP